MIAVYLLYALLAVFAAPPVLRDRLAEAVSAYGFQFGAKSISINPFTLSISLKDLEFKDHSTDVQTVRAKELYLNLQLSSVFKRAIDIRQIALREPHVQLIKSADGRYNFEKLLGSARRDAPATAPLRLILHDLNVKDGRIYFNDLYRPEPFSLAIQTINVQLAGFDTMPERSGTFAIAMESEARGNLALAGKASLNPFYADGLLSVSRLSLKEVSDFLRGKVPFEMNKGAVEGAIHFKLFPIEGGPGFLLHDGDVEFSGIELTSARFPAETVSLPVLSGHGISFDLKEQRLTASKVEGRGGEVRLRLEPKPAPHLVSVFSSAAQTEVMPAAEAFENRRFSFKIDDILAREFRLVLTNAVVEPVLTQELHDLEVSLKNLSNLNAEQIQIKADGVVQKSGVLKMQAHGTLLPLSLEIETNLEKVPLQHFGPNLSAYLTVALESGTADLHGKAALRETAGQVNLDFSGNAAFSAVRVLNAAGREEIMALENLDLNPLSISMAPLSITVENGNLTGLRLALARENNGQLNVGSLSPAQRAGHSRLESRGSSDSSPRFAVNALQISDAKVSFQDNSLPQAVKLAARNIVGSVHDFSSADPAAVKINLSGTLEPQSALNFGGELNFGGTPPFNNFNLRLDDASLAAVGPYIERATGTEIKGGDYSLMLDYKSTRESFNGSNKILIRGLTFGGKSRSKDAGSMPIEMAAALLADSEGKISIEFPVSGRKNDPGYQLGGVFRQALINTITRIATSPFGFLASLAQTSRELDHSDFEAGSSDLSFEERERLNDLAVALSKRESLKLKVVPRYNTEKDLAGLKETLLKVNLERLKNGAEPDFGFIQELPTGRPQFSPEEYEKFVRQLYRRVFGRSSDNAGNAHGELIAALRVSTDLLPRLAAERGRRIREFLTAAGKVREERIAIEQPSAGPMKDDKVVVPLALSITG